MLASRDAEMTQAADYHFMPLGSLVVIGWTKLSWQSARKRSMDPSNELGRAGVQVRLAVEAGLDQLLYFEMSATGELQCPPNWVS